MKGQARRKVAMNNSVAVSWRALFVRGVAEYAQQHGNWVITTNLGQLSVPTFYDLNAYSLRGWDGDGAILGITSPAEAQVASRLGIPVVNISGAVRNARVPRVMVDDYAVGRLAAEHFLERGFRHMAYCGTPERWYSEQRRLGFAEGAKEAGVPCEVFELFSRADVRMPWQRQVAPLVRWLQGLQRPVGIMATNDHLARVVVNECQQLGLNVPHEAAVIGSDNDTIVCEFDEPTLSSVLRSARQEGYEAAALLDRLMDGEDPPAKDILIPPDGIVARQSTDTVKVDDPQVAAAIRFMCDHLGDAFGVERVLRHVAICAGSWNCDSTFSWAVHRMITSAGCA